ncbi:hypothetical protein JTE90_002277 [Oedothorax gibbosus]|uniref:Uncharacterized protein n=1 Tax=Oedothorax gibbosus TaxID=931172 RepID=A0AAV6UGU2_9ARAC|nr:hypothetical protein JTE90_002277 [Oedothorax gibbosus]
MVYKVYSPKKKKYLINKINKAKKFKKKRKISPVKIKKVQKVGDCVPYVYPAGIKIDDIGLLCRLQNSSKQYFKKIYKPKITESYVPSKKSEESIVELDTSEISELSPKKTSKLSSSKRQETKDLAHYHHRLAVERKDRLQYIMERYENDTRNDVDDEVDFNDFTLITKSGESKDFGCEDWNPDGYIFSKKNTQHMRKLVKSAQMNVKSTDIREKIKCGKLPNLSKKNRWQKSPEKLNVTSSSFRAKTMLKSLAAQNHSVLQQSTVLLDSDLDETLPCYSKSKQFDLKGNLNKTNYAPNKSFSFVDLGRSVSFMSTTTTTYNLDIDSVAQDYDSEDSLAPAESVMDMNETKIPPSSKGFPENKSSFPNRDLLDKEANLHSDNIHSSTKQGNTKNNLNKEEKISLSSVTSFSSVSGCKVLFKNLNLDMNNMALDNGSKNLLPLEKSANGINESAIATQNLRSKEKIPNPDVVPSTSVKDNIKTKEEQANVPSHFSVRSFSSKSGRTVSLKSITNKTDHPLADLNMKSKLRSFQKNNFKSSESICSPEDVDSNKSSQLDINKGKLSSDLGSSRKVYKDKQKRCLQRKPISDSIDKFGLKDCEVRLHKLKINKLKYQKRCRIICGDLRRKIFVNNYDKFAFIHDKPQNPLISDSQAVSSQTVCISNTNKNFENILSRQDDSDIQQINEKTKPEIQLKPTLGGSECTRDSPCLIKPFKNLDRQTLDFTALSQTPKSCNNEPKLRPRSELFQLTPKINSVAKITNEIENHLQHKNNKNSSAAFDSFAKPTTPTVNLMPAKVALTEKNAKEVGSYLQDTLDKSLATNLCEKSDALANNIPTLPETPKSSCDDNEKAKCWPSLRCKLFKTSTKNYEFKFISSSTKNSKKVENETRQDSSEATEAFTIFDDIINKSPSLPKICTNFNDDREKPKLVNAAPTMNLTLTNVSTPKNSKKMENLLQDSSTSNTSNRKRRFQNVDDCTNRNPTLPESFGDGHEKTKHKSRRELFKTTSTMSFTSEAYSTTINNIKKVDSPLQDITRNSSDNTNLFKEFDDFRYPKLLETCKSFADKHARPELTSRSELFKTATTNLNIANILSSKHSRKVENKGVQDSSEATKLFAMSGDFMSKHPSLPETPKNSSNQHFADEQERLKLTPRSELFKTASTNLNAKNSTKHSKQIENKSVQDSSEATKRFTMSADFINEHAFLPKTPKISSNQSFVNELDRLKRTPRNKLFKTVNTNLNAKNISSTKHSKKMEDKIIQDSSEATKLFTMSDDFMNKHHILPETPKISSTHLQKHKYVSIHELYKTSDINLSSKKVSSAKSTKKMHSSWQDVSLGSSDATHQSKFDELTMNKNPSLPQPCKTNLNPANISKAKNMKKIETQIQSMNINSEFKRIHSTNEQTFQQFVDPPKCPTKKPKYSKKLKLSEEMLLSEDHVLVDNPPQKSTTCCTLSESIKYKNKKVTSMKSTVQHNSVAGLEVFEFVEEDFRTSKTFSTKGKGQDKPKKRLSKPKPARTVSSSPKKTSPNKTSGKIILLNKLIESAEVDVLSSPSIHFSPSVKTKSMTFNKMSTRNHIDNSILSVDRCTLSSPLINAAVTFLKKY